MISTKRHAFMFWVGALLSAGCAAGPTARPETARRVPDTAPDKVAAQRAAAGLHEEEDDDRWGFSAARELKSRQEPRRDATPATSATPGSIEVRQPAGAAAP